MAMFKTPATGTLSLLLVLSFFLLALPVEARPRNKTTVVKTNGLFLDRPAVVQYWGQNSAGATGNGEQKPLASYCDDVTDVLIIAFVNQFNIGGDPGLSLPCGADCSSVGEDIKTCQASGHKILLSLGGAVGAYGFTDDAQATEFAGTLWDTFGNGAKGGDRPFGDAVLDGFDLDIEGGSSTGYVQLLTELRSLFKSDSDKQYFLTAAPQCPFPDAYLGTDVVANVDAVLVQFYNNPCAIDRAFNFDTWDAWASKAGVKVLIGIPGSPNAAGSGYVSIDTLSSAIAKVSSSSSYGGVMVWDASQSYNNADPSPNFATALGELVHGGGSSSSSAMKNGTSSSSSSSSSGPTRTHTSPGSGTTAVTATTTITTTTSDYGLYTTSVLAPTTTTTTTTTVPTATATNPAGDQMVVKKKVKKHLCTKKKATKNNARSYQIHARGVISQEAQEATVRVKKSAATLW